MRLTEKYLRKLVKKEVSLILEGPTKGALSQEAIRWLNKGKAMNLDKNKLATVTLLASLIEDETAENVIETAD